MFYPRLVLANYLVRFFWRFGRPLIYKVISLADFASHRWYIVGSQDPIIHISSHLIANDGLGVAAVSVLRGPLGISGDFCENFQSARVSDFYVVF